MSGCYRGRLSWYNRRKRRCKALCDFLWHGWNCIDTAKRAVNACVWLIRRRAKIKALHLQQMQGKRKARPFLTG
nr:MAG TPA: hypothetical protein [Caudoviricetes sp.]